MFTGWFFPTTCSSVAKLRKRRETMIIVATRDSTFDLNLIKLSFELEKLCSDTTVASNSQSYRTSVTWKASDSLIFLIIGQTKRDPLN